MTNDELIQEIAGIDEKVSTDGLRKRELELILKGLQADGIISERDKTIEELNAALGEAEDAPKSANDPVKVGKTDKGTVYSTVPQARINGELVDMKTLAQRDDLLQAALKMGAGYLIIK